MTDNHAPWAEIRWVRNSAPYWRAAVMATGRSLVEIPSRGHDGSTGRLTPIEANYYSLIEALSRIVLPPPVGHPRGALLRIVVERRMDSDTFEAIAKDLPGRAHRHTVSRYWNEAYYWLCHPDGGRVLSAEKWGRNGQS